MHRKGFTLVELAIVLVIVGLLVGGILVAKSMISSAHVIGYMRNLQEYQVAVTNFKTNYKSIPGDSTLFTPPGTGNGSNVTDPNSQGFNEYSEEWGHMVQANMIKGNYVAYGWDQYNAGLNYDQTAGICSPIFTVINIPNWLNPPYVVTNKVYVQYLDDSKDTTFNSFLLNVEALALDAKLDDGKTDTGRFTAREMSYSYCGTDMGGNSTLNEQNACSISYKTPDTN